MATSSELQRRIEAFVESLTSEFGPTDKGEHNCLLSAIEDFGVQVGDEVAKTIAQKKAAKQIVQEEPASECCCPVCCSPGQFKGERKRLLDGRSGKLRISEPAYQDLLDEPADHTPTVVSRSAVASIKCSRRFGLQLVAAACEQGFNAATRKAFVCDGQSANWKIWEQWFSHYTPIVDFKHALCYVFAASTAGKPANQGRELYLKWALWLWQGEIDLLIKELTQEQRTIGLPSKDESPTTRRYNIARALTYLANQRGRMDYPEYRRQALPITSSHIESPIKQINKRVKGSEKFWDRAAEAILHLAADHIGSAQSLTRFWAERPATIASSRFRLNPA
jgi:hypothetical protein